MNEYLELVPSLMKLAPDLLPKYMQLKKEFESGLDAEDIEALQQISELHNLQDESKTVPTTIVFEDLLLPYIVNLAVTGEDLKKLSTVMSWIEELAKSSNFKISNLVASCVCEGLVTKYESNLASLMPYIGTKSKLLCKNHFSRFMVTEETQRMFRV